MLFNGILNKNCLKQFKLNLTCQMLKHQKNIMLTESCYLSVRITTNQFFQKILPSLSLKQRLKILEV